VINKNISGKYFGGRGGRNDERQMLFYTRYQGILSRNLDEVRGQAKQLPERRMY
jgi:hypothetical protein